jgi:hypothetical protein
VRRETDEQEFRFPDAVFSAGGWIALEHGS